MTMQKVIIEDGKVVSATGELPAYQIIANLGESNNDNSNDTIDDSRRKLGDVNFDKKINTKDAREVLLYYIGKNTLTSEQKQIADVNKDGKINTKDARQILLYYIGKVKTLE